VHYVDETNGIECLLKIGGHYKQASDYFKGEIVYNTKKVEVTGSYLSHIDFDGIRYWDIRDSYPVSIIEKEKNLPSSSIHREDRILLSENSMEDAQTAKEKLENLQRHDRKLRKEYQEIKEKEDKQREKEEKQKEKEEKQ
jgi:hypothetical protein